MPTLDQIEEYKIGLAGAKHVLLIAQTKLGKSRWVAEAARAGYEILYLDADNGYETLKGCGLPIEALKRIHYLNPKSMIDFCEAVFKQPLLHFNTRTRELLEEAKAKPTDEIVEIWPTRIPKSAILSLDTLTSASWHALMSAADEQGVDVTDIDKYPREIYGKAGFRVTDILKHVQVSPFHVIAQAHPAIFEQKEKPPGVVREVKEKDMIIIATHEVPMSTSANHGYSVGKYFNQIGWIEMNAADRRVISFKTKRNRISGGTPETEGDPLGDHSFTARFGKPPAIEETRLPWIRYLTYEAFGAEKIELAKLRAANAPKLGSGGLIRQPAALGKPAETTSK